MDRLRYVGTWLSLVEHSLGVRGVGSSNLPVPTISIPGLPGKLREGRNELPTTSTPTLPRSETETHKSSLRGTAEFIGSSNLPVPTICFRSQNLNLPHSFWAELRSAPTLCRSEAETQRNRLRGVRAEGELFGSSNLPVPTICFRSQNLNLPHSFSADLRSTPTLRHSEAETHESSLRGVRGIAEFIGSSNLPVPTI